ncbi:MAG: pantetheine-phosphate adenylyltransferase [Gammaproteobacteria bacterium]|nr:pantetheine-phosphate adenylyltransferase [Gammaproteobacteria bacterium]
MNAMYPGTFDPITNGHCDLVRRAAKLYERIVVAVAVSPGKNTLFDIEQRVALTSEALADLANVEVTAYHGLTVDFASQHKLGVIIRGLRAVSDFEFEFQLASMNRRLAEDIETVYLTPTEQFTFVSSSLVREIALLGGDVSEFVPAAVSQALSEKSAAE